MKISRRRFTQLSLAGLAVPRNVFGGGPRKGRPVAAVIENRESYTRNTFGAAIMLERAGFDVISLVADGPEGDYTPSRMVMNFGDADKGREIQQRLKAAPGTFAVGPDPDKVDLIFFGTFANQGQTYHDFLRQYASQIPAFVKRGGVVMEMNQWTRYSFLHPRFLPEGMEIERETWSDTDEVINMVDHHPLIESWAGKKGQRLDYPNQPRRPGRSYEGKRCWQSIVRWDGMQVLLAAGGGYKHNGSQYGRAALVEGEYGRGRYLFSSLWLDKLFNDDRTSVAHEKTMQTATAFFESLKNYVVQIRDKGLPRVTPSAAAPEPWIGPMLGHIDHEKAIIWTRANTSGEFGLRIRKDGEDPKTSKVLIGRANPENDYCIHWQVDGLQANTKYLYSIEAGKQPQFAGEFFAFKTAVHPDTRSKVALAFGSCADQAGRFPELWKQIEHCGAEGMVLLGDTPYIDSTVSVHQRIKHREFLVHEGQAKLSKLIPFWGTWDDHDFGANASDGRIHNRENTRRVFKDYRALTHYGENEEGIYNSFRRGPIEVFVLDTRYFAGTGPSFADASKPTLIGHRQWEWLKEKLKRSNAPFKILASGMSWTSKETGTESDSWGRCAYEREAIIDYIGANRITGVLLVGGDIHCTQVMKLPTEDRIGYPLYHVVTSPMHNRVIREHESFDIPGMLFARAEPNSFLKLSADTTVEPCLLEVDIINITGQSIFRLVTGDDLNVSVHP